MNKPKPKTKKKVTLRINQLPSHCVQCGELMLYGTDWDKFVPICNNPVCPDFGLLQMGVEKMAEIEGARH